MKRRKVIWGELFRALFLPVFAVGILLLFLLGMDNLGRGKEAEDLRLLEDTLRRSCVTCYITEGSYPPSLSYLEEHYGLQLDGARYTVHYEIVAENLMPVITVLENRA